MEKNKYNTKTSVIITCHNYGKYLNESIESVLNQTKKALEVIVVNDASEDDTEKICLAYGDKIKYFKVDFLNSQKTRNYGLKESKGDYVLFLDADDYLRDDYLEKTEKELDKNEDLVLVYSDRVNFGDSSVLRENYICTDWQTEDFDYQKLLKYNYISLPSLIRKIFFEGFDENIKRFQDWEAWIRLLKNKKAKRIGEPLFFARFHGNNLTLKTEGLIERIKILCKHGLVYTIKDDYSKMENDINFLKDKINNFEILILEKDNFIKEITEKMNEDLNKIKEQNIKNEEEISFLKSELVSRDIQINALKNSTSWKITKPVRVIKDKILKIIHLFKYAFLIYKKEGVLSLIKSVIRFIFKKITRSSKIVLGQNGLNHTRLEKVLKYIKEDE